MRLAAIDIGSNSIKVVVVEASDSFASGSDSFAAAASASFAVLASDRETVRLGQETLVNKHISGAAMRRAVDCLRRFRSLAEAHDAQQIIVTATAFLRAADNSSEFIRVVEAETGLHVEVLSGIEEARLIGLAASHGCGDKTSHRANTDSATLNPDSAKHNTDRASLNIDIGGGSTELSIFRNDEPVILRSIPIGAVGLTDRFIRSDPPAPHELDALRSEIRVSLDQPLREFREHSWTSVTATSGTAVTIGVALTSVLPPASNTITLAQLRQLVANLASLTIAERSTVAGILPQRADIIVAGAVVLEEVMTALGVEALTTCDWSLREGVIIDRLRGQTSLRD